MDKTIIRLIVAVIMVVLVLLVISMNQNLRIVIAVAIGFPSLILILISRYQLGKSFTIMPAAKTLVTSGLYARIQHPMYVFLDLFLVAVIIILDWPVLMLVWVFLVIVQMLQVRREEKILAASFGAQYEAYQSRTWF